MDQQLRHAGVSEASVGVVAEPRAIVRPSREDPPRYMFALPILSRKLKHGVVLRGRRLLVQLKFALQVCAVEDWTSALSAGDEQWRSEVMWHGRTSRCPGCKRCLL